MALPTPARSRSTDLPRLASVRGSAAVLLPSSTRVSFRQPVSSTGEIDGAWWPRSLDLAVEAPALLEMLWTASRDVNRVTYNLQAWAAAPRRILVEGRSVRLGGFATSDPLTVRLSDAWGRERLDLLVIAPDTRLAVADRAMHLASRSNSLNTATQLMALARTEAESDPTDVSTHRDNAERQA